jgi:hypothetical protein
MYAACLPRLRVLQAKQVQRNGDRQRLSLKATRLVPSKVANPLAAAEESMEVSAKMACLVAVVQRAPSGLE